MYVPTSAPITAGMGLLPLLPLVVGGGVILGWVGSKIYLGAEERAAQQQEVEAYTHMVLEHPEAVEKLTQAGVPPPVGIDGQAGFPWVLLIVAGGFAALAALKR